MPDDLYQKAIMAKAREAAGAGRLDHPDAEATVDNPVCGDRVTMEIRVSDGRIAAVAHKVRGCLLCKAAASVIGEKAPGATVEEFDAARDAVTHLLESGTPLPDDGWRELSIFEPVTAHKSRHHCVLLPFDALEKALKQTSGH
jgi:nitrogen fixation NifU-like protein